MELTTAPNGGVRASCSPYNLSLADSYLLRTIRGPGEHRLLREARPCQRQEKAPVGRAPHPVVDGAPDVEPLEADGAGPIEDSDGHVVGTAGDSRFHEGL
jgi:hypothetical protein